jgi:hypothetical protein
LPVSDRAASSVDLLYCYQVLHRAKHPEDLGLVLVRYRVPQALQAEGSDRASLLASLVGARPHLSHLKRGHD